MASFEQEKVLISSTPLPLSSLKGCSERRSGLSPRNTQETIPLTLQPSLVCLAFWGVPPCFRGCSRGQLL